MITSRAFPQWRTDVSGSQVLTTYDSDREQQGRVEATRRISVVVGDSNRLLILTLAALLDAQPDFRVVRSYTDIEQVLDAVGMVDPDIVLLGTDLLLADPQRCEETFRDGSVRSKLIVMSSNQDDAVLEASIRAGAVGHIHGGLPPEEIVESVRRVNNGDVLFAPQLLVGLLQRPSRSVDASEAPPAAMPGPRELEVLQLLARGMSTQEIADRLQITTHTVRSHVRNVTAKLKVRTKLEAVMIALREGMIRL